MNITSILDKVRNALNGEPVRFIAYGSAIVVVAVVAVANAAGITRFGSDLSLGDALIGSTAAIATLSGLVEAVRRAVYSPNSVNDLVNDALDTGISPAADQT